MNAANTQMKLWANDRFVGAVADAKALKDFMYLCNYSVLQVTQGETVQRAHLNRYHATLTLSAI